MLEGLSFIERIDSNSSWFLKERSPYISVWHIKSCKIWFPITFPTLCLSNCNHSNSKPLLSCFYVFLVSFSYQECLTPLFCLKDTCSSFKDHYGFPSKYLTSYSSYTMIPSSRIIIVAVISHYHFYIIKLKFQIAWEIIPPQCRLRIWKQKLSLTITSP